VWPKQASINPHVVGYDVRGSLGLCCLAVVAVTARAGGVRLMGLITTSGACFMQHHTLILALNAHMWYSPKAQHPWHTCPASRPLCNGARCWPPSSAVLLGWWLRSLGTSVTPVVTLGVLVQAQAWSPHDGSAGTSLELTPCVILVGCHVCFFGLVDCVAARWIRFGGYP
jgi:hypothetical protein